MNIQGLNPLSVLSSSGAGSEPAGLVGETAGPGLFSAAFLEQLALLQQNLLSNSAAGNPGLAEFQQLSGAGTDALQGQTLQDFSALFGKTLPTATKLDQDINLEDTMQALADVLQYLQGLESKPNEQGAAALLTDSAKQDNQSSAETTNAAQQAANLAVLAQAQVQALPVTESSNALSEVLKTAVATSEAMSAINKSPELLGMDAKKDRLAGLTDTGDTGGRTTAEGSFAKALTAEESASKQFAQDDSANGFNAEQGAGKAALEPKEVENGLTKMAADISQLNKSVSNVGQSGAPALSKHLTHPEWNTELGEKLLWMHKQAVPSAEIRLNPEHLGPISIKIDVNQDQANVIFTAQHAAVRDAIEAAIPKLREMLGGQNLNLADVNVSQQQSEQKQRQDFFQTAGDQQRSGNNQDRNQADAANNDVTNTVLEEIEAGRAIASNGLLSLFA